MKRSEQREQDCWDLTRLFIDNDAWETAYRRLVEDLPNLTGYQGRLGEGAAVFAACLQTMDDLSERLGRVYSYANLKFHQDTGNVTYQSLADRSDTLLVRYETAASFFVPEALTLPAGTLAAYGKDPALTGYEHLLDNLKRRAAHTLSPEQERLLAQMGELAAGPEQIFSMLNEADLDLGEITGEDGQPYRLTKSTYSACLESADRRVRREAYETLYTTYGKQKNTLAAIYAASVKTDNFLAETRGYPTALEAAVDDDAIPASVYENLLTAMDAALPALHRYAALRKRLLGVEDLYAYDLYTPLTPAPTARISYEAAKAQVKKGLAPLGDRYLALLQKGFDSRWIDVYENSGKRSGAYSWGVYPGPPYVLLNHNDTVHAMFTIAHEMGHALHSYLTWEKQPLRYSEHKIFVAEVASTVNEALLLAYLLQNAQTKEEKAYYLNYRLEQFRGTFFRQTLFAAFEKTSHEMAQTGVPLNCENLSALYADLNRKYYGPALTLDQYIPLEWARIPHFYTAFYVYQYATGYAAATTLSQKILQEGAPAVTKYLDFLTKGSSEYSIDLLKGAGVDMSAPGPIHAAAGVFSDTLDQLEALL